MPKINERVGSDGSSNFLSSEVYILVILTVSVSYGLLLSSLPLEAFKDRDNYLLYVSQSSELIRKYWSHGGLTFLFNEPVWLLINSTLNYFMDPGVALRLIIGLPATAFAYILLRVDPKNFFWLLLFLFFPIILKNYVVHLRQGVAISLFLAGYFSSTKSIRWLLLGLTPFIHASFFFILFIFFVIRFSRFLRLGLDVRNILILGGALLIGASLSVIAQILGARQANEYEFSAVDVSGLGFVFWFLVLGIFVLQGVEFIRRFSLPVAVLVFYLCTYFFIEVSGRIFESAVILVLLAGLNMNGWHRAAFIALIFAFGVFSYIGRIGQPLLGF